MLRIGPISPGSEVTPEEFVLRNRSGGGPWVEICMITTPDGATSQDGRSAPLGGPADQVMLRAWRSACGVILVGAGTVRAEGYGLPSRQDLRVAVVTRTCEIDPSLPLFASGRGFLVTAEDAPPTPLETLRAGTGTVDLGRAVAELASRTDNGVIHVEGGPSLNGSLLDLGLVSAINLTFSHRIVGPHQGDPISRMSDGPRRFSLVDAASADGFVFARYERVS